MLTNSPIGGVLRGVGVSRKTVLIISEYPEDFYSLGAALDRARHEPFKYVTVGTQDQPVEALMDPDNDVVILAYTPETEYLLRLAKKKNLTLPIIVLIDRALEVQVGKLKAAGASDYFVRGQISDDLLHRVLDYSIALANLKQQHEQVLQRIRRSAQQSGNHLRSVAKAIDNWFINLGTFSSDSAAQHFASSLAPSSHQIEVRATQSAGQNLYLVRLVNLSSAKVAEALATDYQVNLGGNRPWVGQH